MTNRAKWTALAVGSVLALAGCGSAPSEEQRLREAVADYGADMKAKRYADACQRTTDSEECLTDVMTARAFGVEASEAIPSNFQELVEDATITVQGNSATIDATSQGDSTWVKREGDWLYEMPSDD